MNSTKKITEGAMMAAIIGALLIFNRQTANFIDFAMFWIVPLPVVLYTTRYGVKNAMMLVVSVIVIAVIAGMPSALYYSVMGSILGICLGEAARQQKQQGTLLLISCVVSIVSTFFGMFVFASILGYNLMDETTMTIAMITEVLEPLGMMDQLESLINFVPILVMMSLVLTALLEGVLVYLLSYIVLRRMKIKTTPMKPISQIQLPKIWGYIFLLGYIGSILVLNSGLFIEYSNIYYFIEMISMLVLVANGYICVLTIMAYYKKKSMVWLLVLGVFPPFSFILLLIGYLDSVKNLRWEETVLKQERR